MANLIADMTEYSNQVLLDMAAWAGVSVWYVIASIASVVIVMLLITIYLLEKKQPAAAPAPVSEVPGEFVEKTLAEIPADMIKTEGSGGKIVIKLVSPKPAAEEKPPLLQEIKGEPLLTKVEEPKKEIKPPEPPSKPIAMGTAEKQEEKK